MARRTAPGNCSSASAAPNAAQHRVVVLMLLRLAVVSPQPPSEFWCAASQLRPARIRDADREEVERAAFATVASAVTAVAVERALLDNSPTQWPSGVRAASNSAVARARAVSSREQS